MDKKKLAIGILLLAAVPLVLYNIVTLIAGYMPITESYKKTPYQFEEAFNEQMAGYGMSIDIDSVNFTYGGNYPYKTVPILCDDGSQITCTYYPTSERRKSLIMGIEFEQQLTGDEGETIYIEPLLAFLLQEFETPMLEDKDYTHDPDMALTYNEAMQQCINFIAGDVRKVCFNVCSYKAAYEEEFELISLIRSTEGKGSYELQYSILASIKR